MTDYFEHIDDYIADRLTPEKRNAFEVAMASDSLLKQAVDNYDYVQKLALDLIDIETRDILNKVESTKPKSAKHYLKWIAVTALFFIMIIAYIILNQASAINIQYAEIYTPPNWESTRGVNTDSLDIALRLAQQGNSQAAIDMLNYLDLPSNTKDYWKAEVFAQTEQADSVLHYLPVVENPNPLRDRINYLKIISLYSKGEDEALRIAIDQLPSDTDKYYMEVYLKFNL